MSSLRRSTTPHSAARIDASALVEVGAEGDRDQLVLEPGARDGNPFDRPFAWALVKLDGADTAMLHAVDATADAMSTGMRVRIRWADETVGFINDIACFERRGVA